MDCPLLALDNCLPFLYLKIKYWHKQDCLLRESWTILLHLFEQQDSPLSFFSDMKTTVGVFFSQGNLNLSSQTPECKIYNVTTSHSICYLCSLSKWKPVFIMTAALVALHDFHFRDTGLQTGFETTHAQVQECKLTRLAGDTCHYSQIRHTCSTRSETKYQWKEAMGTAYNTTVDIPPLHTGLQLSGPKKPIHILQLLILENCLRVFRNSFSIYGNSYLSRIK